VRREATTIMAVFPSPNEVMSILVQRVLEQRVTAILDKLLIKPSLANLPPIEEGGLLHYLRVLAVAYDKTKELAKELQSISCGDLDIEGILYHTTFYFVLHPFFFVHNNCTSVLYPVAILDSSKLDTP
jgi:hypothetical protein